MPKVSEEHKEARKRQILEAAVYCFAEKGFHPTTMQDICKRAELSPGAVYLYFPGKEQLIEALVDFLHEMNQQSFVRIRKGKDLRESLEAAFDLFFTDENQQEKATEGKASMAQDIVTRLDVMFLAEAIRSDSFRNKFIKATDRNGKLYHELIAEAQAAGIIKTEWSAEAIGDMIESIYFSLALSTTVNPSRSFGEHRKMVKAMIIKTFFTE